MAKPNPIYREHSSTDLFSFLQSQASVGTWKVIFAGDEARVLWSDITYDIHELERGSPISLEEGIQFYIPQHRSVIEKAVNQAITIGQPWDLELQILTCQGHRRWVRSIGRAIHQDEELVRLEGIFQDIDGQKKFAEDLQQANESLRLYRSAMDEYAAFCRISQEGLIQEVNDRLLRSWEVDEKDVILHDFFSFFQDEKSLSFFRQSGSSLKDHQSWRGRLRRVSKTGITKHFETLIVPKKLTNGSQEFICLQFDISRLIDQKEEIHIANERLKLALEVSQIGVFDLYISENRLVWDDQMYQLYGVERSDKVEAYETWAHSLHPEDRDRLESAFQAALSGEREFNETFRILTPRGEERYIQGIARVLRGKKSEPLRILGLNWDITKRIESERELLKARQLLQAILDNLPGPVYAKRPGGEYIFVNQKFLEVIPALKDENRNSLSDHFIFDEPTRAELQKNDRIVLEGEKTHYFRERVPNQLGDLRYYETFKFPLTDPITGEKFVTGISVDITERIQMEVALEQQKILTENQARLAAIGELAAGVGHEINNPLAIIVGYLQKMRAAATSPDWNPGLIVAMLDKAISASDRIKNIVKGLRTFSRAQNLEREEYSLQDAVKSAVDFISEIYQREGIDLCFESGDLSWIVMGNKGRMEQAILNLLSNAKDAVESASSPKIEIKLSGNAREVIIEVRDNGVGVPTELREKIFEAFFTTKSLNKGTGIGLSLVSGIVTEHLGSLSLQSEEGRGSCFKIHLPARLKDDREHAAPQERSFEKIQMQARVLIVDDEPALREILSDYLTDHGMQVEEASNGREALEKLKNQAYDVVIVDVRMPKMDGPTLIPLIRPNSVNREIRILMSTGSSDFDLKKQGSDLESMVEGVLFKPYQSDKLMELIRQSLKSSSSLISSTHQ